MAPEKAKDITWVDVEFPEGPTYLFRLHAPDDGPPSVSFPESAQISISNIPFIIERLLGVYNASVSTMIEARKEAANDA